MGVVGRGAFSRFACGALSHLASCCLPYSRRRAASKARKVSTKKRHERVLVENAQSSGDLDMALLRFMNGTADKRIEEK